MPALRMKSGVGSSGSPTQNGTMSLRPMPALNSSRILEAVRLRTAARAAMGSGLSGLIAWRYCRLPGSDGRRYSFAAEMGARRGLRADGGLGGELRHHQGG